MQREVVRLFDWSDKQAIRSQLAALASASWWVYSFSEPPTPDQALWLSQQQSRCPDEIVIRFFECAQADFAFLRHFSRIKTLNIQLAMELENLEFLIDLPALQILCLPETTSPRISLIPVLGLEHLRVLHMGGMKCDLSLLRRLPSLEKLKLERYKLEHLSWLSEARKLQWLAVDLGSIINWGAIPKLSVRYLRLVGVRGAVNLDFISLIDSLELLYVEGMGAVERLPDFSRQRLLRRVYLNRLSKLTDLSALLTARNLEDLIMEESPMDVSRIGLLLHHPTLKHARIGTRSTKKNAAIEQVLGLSAETPEFVYADGSLER